MKFITRTLFAFFALSALLHGAGSVLVDNPSGTTPTLQLPTKVYAPSGGGFYLKAGGTLDVTLGAFTIADNQIAQSKINGLATTLSGLAPKASPTFTGTVVLPSTTSIGTVSNTEISYLDGVTSAIQTQINAKGAGDVTLTGTQTLTNKTLASPLFTGAIEFPGTVDFNEAVVFNNAVTLPPSATVSALYNPDVGYMQYNFINSRWELDGQLFIGTLLQANGGVSSDGYSNLVGDKTLAYWDGTIWHLGTVDTSLIDGTNIINVVPAELRYSDDIFTNRIYFDASIGRWYADIGFKASELTSETTVYCSDYRDLTGDPASSFYWDTDHWDMQKISMTELKVGGVLSPVHVVSYSAGAVTIQGDDGYQYTFTAVQTPNP